MACLLYTSLSSLIMVSATMAVEDSFDHIIRRNGLIRYQQEGRIRTLLEHSPFRYEEQACLLMIKDIVNPSHEQFSYQVTETLFHTVAVSYTHLDVYKRQACKR